MMLFKIIFTTPKLKELSRRNAVWRELDRVVRLTPEGSDAYVRELTAKGILTCLVYWFSPFRPVGKDS